MPGHDLAGFQRLRHNGVGGIGAGQDSGIVHHFPQPYGTGVFHGSRHFLRAYEAAGILKTRDSRNAGRHGQHGFQRGQSSVFLHKFHALRAENIANFMGIVIDSRGAMGQYGPGKSSRRHHGGFDMDVSVQKTGGQIGTAGFDDLRLWSRAVTGVRPHISNPS